MRGYKNCSAGLWKWHANDRLRDKIYLSGSPQGGSPGFIDAGWLNHISCVFNCAFSCFCLMLVHLISNSISSSGADVHLLFIIAPSLACHHAWPTVSWLSTERRRKTESLHHLCSVVSNTIHSSPVTLNTNWNASDKIFWLTSLLAHSHLLHLVDITQHYKQYTVTEYVHK